MTDDFDMVFDKLATLLAPEDLLGAVERGAKLVQAKAKSLASVKTGAMRNGIVTDSYVESGEAVAEVISTSPYSGFVEFGTGPKGAASQNGLPDGVDPLPVSAFAQKGWALPPDVAAQTGIKFTNGQAARPFMRPAALTEKGKIEKVVGNSIRRLLAQAYGGGGGA